MVCNLNRNKVRKRKKSKIHSGPIHSTPQDSTIYDSHLYLSGVLDFEQEKRVLVLKMQKGNEKV